MTAAAAHVQVAQGLVAAWREDVDMVAAIGEAGNIRAALDCSGLPAGSAAVVVRVADQGGYGGIAGRTLITLTVRAAVRSHLDEDASGAVHDAALARVVALMADTADTLGGTLEGWAVRYAAAPTTEEIEMADGAYRATDAVQRLIVQALADGSSDSSAAGGTDGDDGWSPILAAVSDGARRVLQIADWTGGSGTKPATGAYLGATGLVASIASAVDVRGAAGTPGAAGANAITFADATARGAATPAYVGQLGLQLDTLILYRGTATSAGSWTACTAEMVAAYRTQAVAASADVSGDVTPSFSSLLLQYALAGNLTSFGEPTNIADGETGAIWITLGAYGMMTKPDATATAKWGPWTVTGPIVRVGVQRLGSVYYWTAVSF